MRFFDEERTTTIRHAPGSKEQSTKKSSDTCRRKTSHLDFTNGLVRGILPMPSGHHLHLDTTGTAEILVYHEARIRMKIHVFALYFFDRSSCAGSESRLAWSQAGVS